MNTKKEFGLLFLTLILIVTTGFEISILTKMALWHDEAFSALLSTYPLEEMIYRTGLDVHPPFYYILLKGWVGLLGNSLFSLRSFSLFFGILALFSTFLLVKEIFGDKKIALFSSVLLTFNSFFIQYLLEARMFTLGTFLVIISSFFLLKAIKSKRWFWWFFYALMVSCGIYTHYYIFFSILAQGIFLIYYLFRESRFNFFTWLKNKNFQFGLGAYGLVILSYLPWLKIFLSQMGQVQESYWIPPMNFWSIPGTFFKMLIGEGIDAARFSYVLIALIVTLIAVIIYDLKKIKTPIKWLVFLLFIIPFLGATILSIKSSIYLDRYFIFALPFYVILIATAILMIENKGLKNFLIIILIFGSLIAFPLHWLNLDVEKKPGMTEAAIYLNQKIKPNEKIYVGSSFVYFTFKYYNQTAVQPKLYAPGLLPHFSGTALLSPENIVKDFQEGIKKDDIVWMINTTGFGNYQPSVPENWIKIEEKKVQDVFDYRGWIIVSKYQVK